MNRTFLSFLLIIGVAAASVAGGWWLGHRQAHSPASPASGRKVLLYQSPMHPWIKSDQPGNCTICGMKLVPVLEGDAVSDAAAGTVVKLSAHSLATIQVETSPVARQPLRRLIRVAGRIDDDDTAHRRLSAYVEGRIDKLFVNSIGAEVVAGQPLASLFSRELLVARSEYNLAAQRPASPERTSALAGSREKLRRFGLTAGQIEKLPGQTGDTFEIVAPISGTVIERKVYEGQYVKEGEVLFEIADFSRMWFVFDAYERDLAWIRPGQTVEVATPSVPGKVFTAPIAFIDPNLAVETRTAKVRVILDNPLVADPGRNRRELLHKTFADGRIRVDTPPVLVVPRGAVLSPGGEPLVYLEKGQGEYEPRRVTLGRAGDELWEVLAGLQEGERVVTAGSLLVDSQAQLDHPALVSVPTTAPPLSDAQIAGAEKLFLSASAVAEALAADDLAGHNARIEAMHTAAMAFGDPRLDAVAHVGPAKDLTAARKQFYPLSMAVAELAVQSRRAGGVKVFECPMAKSAVPSADTNQGRWVQTSGPLRNPFFGAEMLGCGKEILP